LGHFAWWVYLIDIVVWPGAARVFGDGMDLGNF